VLWTLIGAKLFSRDDGTCPLIGFNLSNSVDNRTIEITAEIRRELEFEDVVRIEHHITETWRSIVVQPYDRRAELLALADHVSNISAKHEGGDPHEDSSRAHPSDILDYFRTKEDIEATGDMAALLRNYLTSTTHEPDGTRPTERLSLSGSTSAPRAIDEHRDPHTKAITAPLRTCCSCP
jgi:hypothetical protein